MSEAGGVALPLDPRAELAELASAVRAFVAWHEDVGVVGVPVDGSPEEAMASIAVPSGSRGVQGARRATAASLPARASGPQAIAAPPPPREQLAPAATSPFVERPLTKAPEVASSLPAAASPPRDVEGALAERRTHLALLAEEVRACTRCVLHERRKQTVFARGNPFAELCFIGEGPGAEEDAQGFPFVGPAGQMLDKMIVAMGYPRDDVYICNIVKCRPPDNRKPEPAEMAACTPFLTSQLALAKPRVIVALGATAVQGLLGTTEGITRLRGKWKLYKGTVPVMPTFHPSYLLRNPPAKRDVWADLQEVMRHMGKALPARG